MIYFIRKPGKLETMKELSLESTVLVSLGPGFLIGCFHAGMPQGFLW
jgi:hypothetical protein